MNKSASETEQTVSLEVVLSAREERAAEQNRLLALNGLPVICFTLNIAGPVKIFPLSERAFSEGISLVTKQLERAFTQKNISICQPCTVMRSVAGHAAFWCLDVDSLRLKKLMCEIEDNNALGRLFDIDILKGDSRQSQSQPYSRKISREEVGLPMRTCLMCANPAAVCARSRQHDYAQLRERAEAIISEYFVSKFAFRVASLAVRALLFELAVTPKPGLVDRHNNGAHHDMDFFLFISSGTSLFSYFYETAKKAGNFHGSHEELFALIRYEGKCAESTMMRATGGINTHKGAVFALGLACAAAAFLRESDGSAEAVCEFCAAMTAGMVRELSGMDKQKSEAQKTTEEQTHGEKMFLRYGFTGIRGEASMGFPSVIQYALPLLRDLLALGVSENEAGVLVLLRLFGVCEDTNLIYRSNLETFNMLRSQVDVLFTIHDCKKPDGRAILLQKAAEFDEEFMRRNISPGGSADLLALTFFLYFLETK